jgi:DNA-binding MarR family transcriptional regulator
MPPSPGFLAKTIEIPWGVTLDDLRVFTIVYETGNLSAVARDLSRTQSAVSQHIKRLERETGLGGWFGSGWEAWI